MLQLNFQLHNFWCLLLFPFYVTILLDHKYTSHAGKNNEKWDGSESGYHASAEALILAPSMTAAGMAAANSVTGDAMASAAAPAAGDRELGTHTSHRARDPLLPIMSSASLYDPSNPMYESVPTEATPVLPHEAAFHLYPSDPLRMGALITISQTYSRPMGSTSRITVWKHRNSQDRPTNFTITESFFINQVITGM